MELNLQDVDLRDELEELRALFSAEASRAGLTLELELDDVELLVWVVFPDEPAVEPSSL